MYSPSRERLYGSYESRRDNEYYGSSRDRPGASKSYSSRDSERFSTARRYGSRDELNGSGSNYRSGNKDGSIVGILKNRDLDTRYYSSKQRNADSSHDAGDNASLLGGNAHLHQHDEGSSRVKYRIQGEITRTDSPDDRLRGYSSDHGHYDRGYVSDRGYSSETSGRRSAQRDRSLTLPSFRDSGNRYSSERRSMSVERSSQLRVGRPLERDGPDRGQHSMPSEPDDGGLYRSRARSASPVRYSGLGPSGRVTSPSRKPRRASSMSNLLAERGHRGGRNTPTDNGAGFPVCSRWPNCTVCSIDIPSSQVVSIARFEVSPSPKIL